MKGNEPQGGSALSDLGPISGPWVLSQSRNQESDTQWTEPPRHPSFIYFYKINANRSLSFFFARVVENSNWVTTGTHHRMDLRGGRWSPYWVAVRFSMFQTIIQSFQPGHSPAPLTFEASKGILEFRSLELWCPGCHSRGASKRHSHSHVPSPWKAVFATEWCVVPEFDLLPEFLKIPLCSYSQGNGRIVSSTSSL